MSEALAAAGVRGERDWRRHKAVLKHPGYETRDDRKPYIDDINL